MHHTGIRGVAVTCRPGRRTILAGIDVHAGRGEILQITGVNGAGKTTLLRCLAGTMPVTSGMLDLDGARAGSPAARRSVGSCLNPEQGLYPRLSGRQNLVFAARLLLPAPKVAPAVAAVEGELGITPFARGAVRDYSAGMRARIGLARALLGTPSVLLFDEPTRSLDEDGRGLFWAAVLARPDTVCVFASHLAADTTRATATVALSLPAPR